MKNILILTLLPLDNDNRVLKEIKTISNMGHDITVVSVNTKSDFFFKSLSFKSESKRLIGIPGLSKMTMFYKYFKLMPIRKNFELIHCHDLDAFILGCLYRRIYCQNAKLIYDAHEYETEISGLSGIRKTIIKTIEKLLIRYADETICVSNAIADEYVRLYNIPKPQLILNTPPFQEMDKKDIFREALNIERDKTIFLYQGGLSKGRGIEILLDTFKMINDNKSVIVFMGYGLLEESVKEISNEYENIYFHKAVSPDILLDYTSSADFGILFYENSCLNHYYCSPNKMFEYLMAEIPVIVSNLYEMKRLVENNCIGVVAKENNPHGLKEAIQNAVGLNKEELQRNIQKIKEIYNWEEQEIVLENIYHQLLYNNSMEENE